MNLYTGFVYGMIHEDFRSKLKESLYNSLILTVAKPNLCTWNRHNANTQNITSNNDFNFIKDATG